MVPKNLKSLLGLGLKFCPVPRVTTRDPSHNLARFERNLLCKTYFGLDEDDPRQDDFEPKFYQASAWTPAEWMIPKEVIHRSEVFQSSIKNIYRQKPKRRRTQNLLPHQRFLLSELRNREDLLVVKCDKNLGPAVIEKSKYINLAFTNHLSDSTTYKELTAQHRFYLSRVPFSFEILWDWFCKAQ